MSDLEALLENLAASTRGFIAVLDGLSAEGWNYRPAPEQWSIGEVAEHVAVVNRGIERLCRTKIVDLPLGSLGPAARISDADIVRLMADRSRSIEAPDMVKPKGRWATREAFTRDFLGASDGLIDWARGCRVDLRSVGAPHPRLGMLDAMQWLSFVAAHTDRHAKQVEQFRQAGGV